MEAARGRFSRPIPRIDLLLMTVVPSALSLAQHYAFGGTHNTYTHAQLRLCTPLVSLGPFPPCCPSQPPFFRVSRRVLASVLPSLWPWPPAAHYTSPSPRQVHRPVFRARPSRTTVPSVPVHTASLLFGRRQLPSSAPPPSSLFGRRLRTSPLDPRLEMDPLAKYTALSFWRRPSRAASVSSNNALCRTLLVHPPSLSPLAVTHCLQKISPELNKSALYL